MDLMTKRCPSGHIHKARESCPACAERKRAEVVSRFSPPVNHNKIHPLGRDELSMLPTPVFQEPLKLGPSIADQMDAALKRVMSKVFAPELRLTERPLLIAEKSRRTGVTANAVSQIEKYAAERGLYARRGDGDVFVFAPKVKPDGDLSRARSQAQFRVFHNAEEVKAAYGPSFTHPAMEAPVKPEVVRVPGEPLWHCDKCGEMEAPCGHACSMVAPQAWQRIIELERDVNDPRVWVLYFANARKSAPVHERMLDAHKLDLLECEALIDRAGKVSAIRKAEQAPSQELEAARAEEQRLYDEYRHGAGTLDQRVAYHRAYDRVTELSMRGRWACRGCGRCHLDSVEKCEGCGKHKSFLGRAIGRHT